MAEANPQWDAPRMHGELLKLGIDACHDRDHAFDSLLHLRQLRFSIVDRAFGDLSFDHSNDEQC
jgi:hypothetical protein